ncbi:hypothetical protein HMI48_10355 [Acidithiobacillus ferrooxidans]|uniref:hypothetical protein n=1 Tax=Acidithiobacillus ferrooxidans TaxID=920 RepID=UPI001C07486A|nr:hypothetical protein [Acidithiobacillus ferrooxidans]MBU2774264.1 hypothetical protein [Acidithiobacillus ferrooxidans]
MDSETWAERKTAIMAAKRYLRQKQQERCRDRGRWVAGATAVLAIGVIIVKFRRHL